MRFLCLLLIFSFKLFASDTIELPVTPFELQTPNINSRIDESIKNPESILNRYVPAGLSVKDKKISGNTIEFMATKTVLGISRTVFYHGILDIDEIKAPKNNRCFLAELAFTGSGPLIIDNIEKLHLTLCVKETSTDHMRGDIKPLLFKGNNYGGLLGTIAKNIVIDQIDPMIKAVKEEIESK
jgi:hypothetical protein